MDAGRVIGVEEVVLIESLYWSRRAKGGQRAQLDDDFENRDLARRLRTPCAMFEISMPPGRFIPRRRECR